MNQIITRIKKVNFLEYIIVYLAFAFGATSFFSGDRYKIAGFIILVFLLFLKQRNKSPFNMNLWWFVIYFVLIFFAQSVRFGQFNYQAFVFVILTTILLPYLLLNVTRKYFITAYINVIYFFSITSLIFWIASNISPDFYEFTSTIPLRYNTDLFPDNYKMFIIYTYESSKAYNITRNPGPTWEPGGWAVFVTVALILNLLKNKKIINIKNILFIVNILSTLSTTAYLALGLLVLYFLLFNPKINLVVKVLSVMIFSFLSFRIYNDVEFMKQKIQYNIVDAQSRHIKDIRTGRFFALRKALITYQKYPITGRGLVSASAAEEGEAEGTGYGIVDIGARFGILALVAYLIIFYNSLKTLVRQSNTGYKHFHIAIYLILLLHMLSQGVHTTPVFLLLFFIVPSGIVLSYEKTISFVKK